MRQKLIVAGFIVCIAMAGCKSRFTSTSDSSGPRKYENADPAFQHSGNTGTTPQSQAEKIDSTGVMNMHGDTNHVSVDPRPVTAH